MLNEPQIARMLSKLEQLEKTLDPFIFQKQGSLTMKKYETTDQLDAPPADSLYVDAAPGDVWGGERSYCWFQGSYTVPAELDGKAIYLYPHLGSYETMLFVDGVPYGNYAYKIAPTAHGNHYCDLLRLYPSAGDTIQIDLEAYAGHYVIGCMPFETCEPRTFRYTYESVDICTKNQDIADFIYDLRTLNQLAAAMDPDSFRRADVINCLTKVHETVYYSPEFTEESVWRAALKEAREIMRPCLEAKNADSAPKCGIIGHSHMDTAWLWDISETVKKCARTYSKQMALMDEFPEYTFVQSSAYHAEMIRRHYPELFKRMQERIKEGRYEPNGGVWVECDCNITSGEAMIRQFLWGQRYTRKYFNFTSDAFWLPDTFGYSAAIPQIMKGCGVKYFLTTKMTWNDTNAFPYDTFLWEGIDGSQVLVHFNTIQNWPEPKSLIGRTEGHGEGDSLRQKTVTDQRLISYGFGDGGGGPQFEEIEMSRRCADLDGCPKAYHTTVSAFMQDLEKNVVRPNRYAGELYLELHRGTLTGQHTIKRNNRKCEIALHNAELVTVANAVAEGREASGEKIAPLMETLLVNQFHDILPGTCITTAMQQSERDMAKNIAGANELIAAETKGSGSGVTAVNTLSFPFDDVIRMEGSEAVKLEGVCQQTYTGLDGKEYLAVSGVSIPAFSSVSFARGGSAASPSAFSYEGRVLTTPFAKAVFNEKGYISSFTDLRSGRELVNGLPLNTFLMGEDTPSAWDNWDIDADAMMKLKDCAELTGEEVVSDGSVEFRFRRTYRLSDRSTIRQDMVFYAHSPRVDFETEMNWHDKRRLLKTAFDTAILARQARHEIQFGYACKPTTRNNSLEQAMFEVINHKYTDLSETRCGCALLNDCKYGITAEGGSLRLSLHKSGVRPDTRGDEGLHTCAYSFLPHDSGFSAESVIRPAYRFNYPPVISQGEYTMPSLLSVEAPNVIAETVKPCEDVEKAFIVRLYEAEGTYAETNVTLPEGAKSVEETNMLEEILSSVPVKDGRISLSFRPFEIKTIKISY